VPGSRIFQTGSDEMAQVDSMSSTPVSDFDLARVEDSLELLGDPGLWEVPDGYPNSLALCLLDSIWSLGVNYDRHVVPVLKQYRALSHSAGHTPDRDNASDLVEVINSVGGPDAFADRLGNRQRTSTRKANSILKAAAVEQAAHLMTGKGVETPADLRARAELVRTEWRQIPGQRYSPTGWRYLLLLAGVPEAKPDRMICRFLEAALDRRRVKPDAAHSILVEMAARVGTDLRALDHRILAVPVRTPTEVMVTNSGR
jgi:hypothetical protein